MSVATIVSLLPFEFRQSAPGLYPVAEFIAPPAMKDDFQILHVNDGWFNVYIDHQRGNIKVHQSAEHIAKAITFDAIANKPYGVELGVAEPGIFMIEGMLSKEDIKKKHADVLGARKAMQDKWFLNLVQDADNLWNQYHNHRMISDTCRLASKMLGLEREWNVRTTVENMRSCPACTTQIPSKAIVCPACRAILDKKAAAEFEFAKA